MKHTTYKITYEITGRIASGEVVGRHEYDTELQAREDLRVKTELCPITYGAYTRSNEKLLDQFLPQKENVGKPMPGEMRNMHQGRFNSSLEGNA
jgi:hypothetical protein